MRNSGYLYLLEFNRNKWDSIRACAKWFQRHGCNATRVAHLTTLLIERPVDMDWGTFKSIIRKSIQPRRGSVVISSRTTGKIFLCSNRGNQPGYFQLIA